MVDPPFVVPLAGVGRDDLDLAGGKGANLGELVRHGFPVPGGFVVTTRAYAVVVDGAGLGERIAARLAAGEDDGAGIRADVTAVAVPDELRSAIAGAYSDLGGGPVAVRSSATAEDLPGAAFAGQQDTYLNVIGAEAVVDAVSRCWASLWTERAIAYRRQRGVDSGDVLIAVVVQRMVDAESAGVMFTANPVTGRRDQIVVDASTGLGEAVVSGLVTPDHYVLDRRGRVTEWTPGRREVVIRGSAGGGVTHRTDEQEGGRVLTDASLRELARLGTVVASHYGRPQDTEWAVAEGRVWLVQARPMTALPPPPLRLGPLRRRIAPVLLDYVTSRPYPIDMTTWVPYGPVGMMEDVLRDVGLRQSFADMLPETDGVVDRFVPPVPRPAPRLLTAPFRMLRKARRFDPARWTDDPRFTDLCRRVEVQAARDPAAMAWPELVLAPREALDLVRPITDLRTDYLPGFAVGMARLVVTLLRLGRHDLTADLAVGAPTLTEAANRALGDLADMVRDDPHLRARFAELDGERLVGAVRDEPDLAAFREAFATFLTAYGHRETASPVLVSPPTWGEAPEVVLTLVKALVDRPPEPAPDTSRSQRAVERLLEHRALRNPRRRARVLATVDAARAGIAFREDSHFHFTRALPILRRTLLEIGRRLREAGVLRETDEVFHLRLDEIEAIRDLDALGEQAREQLRGLVVARAAKREELSGVRLIDLSAVFPPGTGPEGTADGEAVVRGASASGGSATGPVRVVMDVADFGKLRTGDVLVCPYTNPAWTPLFRLASAVVVDSGGIGSHAAIVAREYGIPALMGTGSGTAALSDDQVVTVDGDAGRVTLAEPEVSR
ncbi:MAG: phosphoenolpyruvate synthase [Streptosporangiales bacterium]|nr:phosphoenolpyruvate synthase [Streptosporangiales bacterium]